MQKEEESSATVIIASLSEAIDGIKNYMKSKNVLISEKDMADKLNITEEQFYTYLSGKEGIPVDLTKKLLSAYNYKIVRLSHVIQKTPRFNIDTETDSIE